MSERPNWPATRGPDGYGDTIILPGGTRLELYPGRFQLGPVWGTTWHTARGARSRGEATLSVEYRESEDDSPDVWEAVLFLTIVTAGDTDDRLQVESHASGATDSEALSKLFKRLQHGARAVSLASSLGDLRELFEGFPWLPKPALRERCSVCGVLLPHDSPDPCNRCAAWESVNAAVGVAEGEPADSVDDCNRLHDDEA